MAQRVSDFAKETLPVLLSRFDFLFFQETEITGTTTCAGTFLCIPLVSLCQKGGDNNLTGMPAQ